MNLDGGGGGSGINFQPALMVTPLEVCATVFVGASGFGVEPLAKALVVGRASLADGAAGGSDLGAAAVLASAGWTTGSGALLVSGVPVATAAG